MRNGEKDFIKLYKDFQWNALILTEEERKEAAKRIYEVWEGLSEGARKKIVKRLFPVNYIMPKFFEGYGYGKTF